MADSLAKSEIENALLAKGFLKRVSDHSYFIYHTLAGKKTLAKTKTSLGRSPKTIGGELLHAMAKQCYLTNTQFRDLVFCPLTRSGYEAVLKEKGVLK